MRRWLPLLTLALLLFAGCDEEIFQDDTPEQQQEKETKDKAKKEQKEQKKKMSKGKASDEEKLPTLEMLLKPPSDETFDRSVDTLAHSGKPASVMTLTAAMIQLPYEKNLAPRQPGDLRMRKLRIARELGRLLPIPERDQLMAKYLRALLEGQGSPKTTGDALLAWTKENQDNLRWDPYLYRYDCTSQPKMPSLRGE
jgi:hypothetical protein